MISSPAWHLHDLDVPLGEFKLLSMSENDYRRSVFLDRRIRSTEKRRIKADLEKTVRLFLGAGRRPCVLSFIFHVGHCGSTLLSRALSGSRSVLPLREPKMLNVLADTLREIEQPYSMLSREQWERLRDAVLIAQSRTFRPGQHSQIKATSTCNNLVIPLLEAAPEARAILLYQPLEQCIAGSFKPHGVSADLATQARCRMQEWVGIPGAPALRNSDFSFEQFAVLSWLTSMYRMSQAAQRLPGRTAMVDFNRVLAQPEHELVKLDSFLGIGEDAVALQEHYSGIAKRYSKNQEKPFRARDREKALSDARAKHGKLIARGVKWAEHLVRTIPALEPCSAFLE